MSNGATLGAIAVGVVCAVGNGRIVVLGPLEPGHCQGPYFVADLPPIYDDQFYGHPGLKVAWRDPITLGPRHLRSARGTLSRVDVVAVNLRGNRANELHWIARGVE